MCWKIVLYSSSSGDKPVEEFIKSLQKPTQAKVIRIVELLEKFGNNLGAPYSKKINNKLYELRIKGKEEVRILYTFDTGKVVYLLHGFKKKSQKTPREEMEVAGKRLDRIYRI